MVEYTFGPTDTSLLSEEIEDEVSGSHGLLQLFICCLGRYTFIHEQKRQSLTKVSWSETNYKDI